MRFPSYSSEWHSYTLGEILTFYSTNSFSREKLNYDTGSVKNIHYGDIHTKFPSIVSIDNNKDIPFINDDLDLSKFSEDQYLREGDLIIADASEDYEDIGKAIEVKDINNEKVLAGLHTILARDENDMAVNGFKAYLFSTNNLKTKIKIIANGISVLGISKNNLSKLNVEIPSKKEQQNIVSFISDIDKKIELLEKKHQLYLDFKNYLMQQIFAQKLRFKNDKQWNVYLLRNFINEYNERMGNKSNLPILSSTLNGIFLQNEYFNKSVSSKDVKNYKIVPNGYFTYRSMSDTGKFRFNIQSIVEVGIISPAYPVFSTQNIDDYFLYYYLNNSNFIKKQILSLKEGGTRYALSFSKFKKLKISLPSLEEQKKIANFLSAVDKKIDLIQTQIQKMEEFKKGLLQQMFVVQLILSLLQNKKHI